MPGLPATAHALGALLVLFSATFLLPIAWAFAQRDPTLDSFLLAALATLAAGLALWLPTRQHRRELQPRDGCLLVVVAWLSMAGFAAIPLYREIPGLSRLDAYFEAVSGLTTTGATVLTGLDRLAQPLNLWRCALSWFGGMGVLVLAVAVLPLLGVGGMQLLRAETPGPMKEVRLTPRIAQTAKSLWLVYVGISAAAILALRVVGLSWFDAICHAFSAVSLGAFSTHDASAGAFRSPVVEGVLALFMLLAAINFATHFVVLRRRDPAPYAADPELRASLALVLGSGLALAAFLQAQGVHAEFGPALRHAMFHAVSLATTTGLTTVDYDRWPAFAPLWLLALSVVASSAGSVGGGIKMMRALILARQAGRELTRLLHPRAINPLAIGGALVENKVIFAVLGFVLLYGMTVVVLTLAMLATGLDLTTALSAVLACVNNVGPGLGAVGPASNYASLTDLQTCLAIFAMLAGRLELLTLYALLVPAFWRR